MAGTKETEVGVDLRVLHQDRGWKGGFPSWQGGPKWSYFTAGMAPEVNEEEALELNKLEKPQHFSDL